MPRPGARWRECPALQSVMEQAAGHLAAAGILSLITELLRPAAHLCRVPGWPGRLAIAGAPGGEPGALASSA
jgi:hypothetical protein